MKKVVLAALLVLVATIGFFAGQAIASKMTSGSIAQFKPCVWPNTCADKVSYSEPVNREVAFIGPCQEGRLCRKNVVALYEPCVWPRLCNGSVSRA
jgi:hypothetical protein